MSKQRYINTVFWDDDYISNLDPSEKLLFIYLITNPCTTICGIYQVPIKRMALDTGIEMSMCNKILSRFQKDDKVLYRDGWIAIRNFIKHQNEKSPKVKIGIINELEKVPRDLKKWIGYGYGIDTVSTQGEYGIDTLSHLNLNLNLDSNLDSNLNLDSDLKEKENKYITDEILLYWNSKNLIKHELKTVKLHFKKLHKDIIHDIGIEKVKEGIENYDKILNDEIYYYSHNYSLWDFIARKKIYNFLTDARPFENYVKKDFKEKQKEFGKVIEK